MAYFDGNSDISEMCISETLPDGIFFFIHFVTASNVDIASLPSLSALYAN